ncbi:MAG: hypothetical protein JST43_12210 [Bacteroidetes bacterium]|nr:hypothetical protein [Bacteroidota bacterium]MBS1541646.1 hypothetical protein [Bacteroidota bacterium]
MKTPKIILSILLTLFGALSVFLTSSIILDVFGIREKEGNYVLFIVYTNLLCGMIYLYAAYALWKKPIYSIYSLGLALLLLNISFFGLQAYIGNGGIYETRTVVAMIFRIAFTVVMFIAVLFIIKKNQPKKS